MGYFMHPADKQLSLHMTVATTPEYDGNIDITSEIRLLKTALMYADKVTFISLASSILIQTLQAISAITNNELLAIAIRHFGGDKKQAYDTYMQLKQKRRKSKQELIALRRVQELVTKAKKEMYVEIDKLASNAGLDQLVQPFESGMLDFREIDMSSGDFSDELVWKYLENVLESILSGETYPIFDKLTSKLVDFIIDKGDLQPTSLSVSQAKQVALSTELLQRLPKFDVATIDEVLDIRKELYRPLLGFRSAIIKYSREIESAAWDKDFPYEANQVFIEHVQPAVLEIEEHCQANSVLRGFLPSLVDKSVMPTGTSFLGILLASADHIPEIVSAGLGLAAGVAAGGIRAYHSRREYLQHIKHNNLYFYYRAGDKLKQR